MIKLQLRSLSDPALLNAVLPVFHSLYTTPTFEEKNITRLKHQQQINIRADEEKGDKVAAQAFMETIYTAFPYGQPTLGTIASIKAITQQDIMTFFHNHFNQSNMRIVIVGDLTTEYAHQLAEQLSQHIPSDTATKTPITTFTTPTAQDKTLPFDSQQATIIIGEPSITRKNKDYFPLMIANTYLGGLPLDSLLMQELRSKRGLVYSTYSTITPLLYPGPLYVILQTNAQQADQAKAITIGLLRDFSKKGMDKKAIQSTKQYLKGNLAIALSSNKNLIDAVSNIAFYQRPLDYLDTYTKNIDRVSDKQINDIIKKWYDPKKMTSIVVGPIKPGSASNEK